MDLGTGAVKGGSYEGADCPGADNCDFHWTGSRLVVSTEYCLQ
jgi:hypothetical protein